MRAYINNKPFDFDQEITILEAARQMGFFIPTLCALSRSVTHRRRVQFVSSV